MATGEINQIRTLPWKLTAQTVGFQHALKRFQNQYGPEEGLRIFLQKADERGEGKTLRQKANNVYKNGAKLS